MEKPQITKEKEIGEFGVHLCVPGYIDPSAPRRSTGYIDPSAHRRSTGYIDPSAHRRSTGLNGENVGRVLHSMLEGGVCTKRDGLSEFDVQEGKQGMFRTLLKNIFLNSQFFKYSKIQIFVISTFY